MFRARMFRTAATAGFAVGFAWAVSGSATAQSCDDGKCAAAKCDAPACGHGGLTPSPKFESRYIAKFCYPQIVPGSCYGHFPTKWAPWPCQPWPTADAAPQPGAKAEPPAKIPPAGPEPMPAPK